MPCCAGAPALAAISKMSIVLCEGGLWRIALLVGALPFFSAGFAADSLRLALLAVFCMATRSARFALGFSGAGAGTPKRCSSPGMGEPGGRWKLVCPPPPRRAIAAWAGCVGGMSSDGRWTGAGRCRAMVSRFTFSRRGGSEPEDKAGRLESGKSVGGIFRFMVKLISKSLLLKVNF